MTSSRIAKKQAKRQADKLAKQASTNEVITEQSVDTKETVVKENNTKETVVEETKNVAKTPKKAVSKKDIKTSLYVEYFGKQVSDKDMIASVKKAWTKSGHKIAEIKSMELYVKPEESAIYYVINKTETGKADF